MSIVIVGGNERMVCQYEDICKGFGCKAKVFAKEKGAMKKKIGAPDLMILFTSTVSHKMVTVQLKKQKENLSRYVDATQAVHLLLKVFSVSTVHNNFFRIFRQYS